MNLSKNFTLEELTKSDSAIRNGINNTPNDSHMKALKLLVVNVLQPMRDKWGPIKVTSGYRSPALNKLIGGSEKSQHSKGEAADFEVIGVDNFKLAEWIRDNMEFDQLILEFYDAAECKPNSGWVHVSYSKDRSRGSVLTAKIVKGVTLYLQGIVK